MGMHMIITCILNQVQTEYILTYSTNLQVLPTIPLHPPPPLMALPSLQLAHRRTALSSSIAYSIQTLRENPCGEIAGSLGDLGTLLPLMTAMAATGSINLNSTLIFSGLFNILSGLGFGIPIVVSDDLYTYPA